MAYRAHVSDLAAGMNDSVVQLEPCTYPEGAVIEDILVATAARIQRGPQWMSRDAPRLRRAWIASVLASAAGFSKETIIPQKPPHDEDSECWRDAYSIRRTPRHYFRPTRSLPPWKQAHRRRAARIVIGRERGEASPGDPR
jgi:hypothetical protein